MVIKLGMEKRYDILEWTWFFLHMDKLDNAVYSTISFEVFQ